MQFFLSYLQGQTEFPFSLKSEKKTKYLPQNVNC